MFLPLDDLSPTPRQCFFHLGIIGLFEHLLRKLEIALREEVCVPFVLAYHVFNTLAATHCVATAVAGIAVPETLDG